MATSSSSSSSSSSTPSVPAPRSAMAAMAAAVFSSPASPTSPAAAASSSSQQPQRRRRKSAFNDAALLRIFAEKDPMNAPHGAKGAAWDNVGDALAREPGEKKKWTGQACRTRILSLLEGFEVHNAGKKTPNTIRQLSAHALKLLERTFYRVAKTRLANAPLAEEIGGSTVASKASPTSTVVVPTALKQAPALQAKPLPKPLATAGAAPRPATDADDVSSVVVPTKATVVAKRRKRKGVKTKEQKRAAAMAEALRYSRETYMNQLRVETAVQAAAKETGESPAKPKTSATSSSTKAKPDLDLSLLRAVVKCSAVEATDLAIVGKRWQAVAEQVMTHTALKFTPTAIRDRCDALLADFELNDCKASTYLSGVAVADEERLKLLRMIHKAHKKQRRISMDKPQAGGAETKSAVDATAIEIDDTGEEQDEEDSPEEETEREQIIEETEDEEEDDDTDEQKHDAPPSSASRKRRRRESEDDINEGGVSPDADPAADMAFEMEDAPDNSQESTASHDYTPRKYKQRRLSNELQVDVEAPASRCIQSSGPLGAVLEAMAAERQERRHEFRAMLDLMKTQIHDNHSKWEREYAQRTREQDARQRESSALLEMLRKEREDRKSEAAALMSTITKERDDRRNEFMTMMTLITKMVENKPTQAAEASAKK